MSQPSQSPRSDARQTGRTASSFGDSLNDSATPAVPVSRPEPRSDMLLSTQLGTGTSQARSTPHRRNRGDVRGSGALERYLGADRRYLASDLPSSRLTSGLGRDGRDLPSAQDIDAPAPVIWGTTISLEDAMTMFKNFITNYCQQDSEDAYYNELLAFVLVINSR